MQDEPPAHPAAFLGAHLIFMHDPEMTLAGAI